MIGLLLALALQAAGTEDPAPTPVRTAEDACVELQGGGVAAIGEQRLRGRALVRAIAESVPPGRALFMRFANERARNDVEGMANVMAGAANAPEIVLVETCELPEGSAQ